MEQVEKAQGPGLGEPGGKRKGKWVGRCHLDAAQGKAASHSHLHILILELLQEAQ